MRKKTIFLIYFLILLLIIIIKVLEPYIGNEISSLLTTATTVIGIFSVFIEMKRSADISECEFIYNLQGQFDNNSKIQNIYEILDKDYSCNTKTKNIDRSDLVSYLTFLETKIKNIDLNDVILDNSEISNTSLNGVDLSSCSIDSMMIDNYSLKGIVIDRVQSYLLVGMLGVKIKE